MSAIQKPLAFWKLVVTSFLLWPSALTRVWPFAIIIFLMNYINEQLPYKAESPASHRVLYIIWLALITLVSITISTSIIVRINSILMGTKISIREATVRGIQKLPDQFMINLVLFGTLFVVLLPCIAILLFASHHEWKGLALFMTSILMVVILIFIYFMIRFVFVNIIMALRDFSKAMSLRQRLKTCFVESYALVNNYWWRTFGVLIIVSACLIVPALLVDKMTKMFGHEPWMTILLLIVEAALFPLYSVFLLVLFYDLQIRKRKRI